VKTLFRRPPILILNGLFLTLAGAAQAQEDPIGALLDKSKSPAAPAAPTPGPAPADAMPTSRDAPPPVTLPVTPPTAPPVTPPPVAAAPPPPTPAAAAPSPPVTYVPRPTTLGEPTHLEETGKAPDGPPSPSDLYFESRVRASFAAAQGMQGPLDGRWVVRSIGADLFVLQLVDKNQGMVEGAWRDLRRKGATDASGFIEQVQRTGGELTIRIRPRPGDDPVQMSLHPLGDGWTGELIERGERRVVSLKRN